MKPVRRPLALAIPAVAALLLRSARASSMPSSKAAIAASRRSTAPATSRSTGVDVDVAADDRRAGARSKAGAGRSARAGGCSGRAPTTGRSPRRRRSPIRRSNAIVSGIVIEQEQIGPNRYIAPARRPVRPRPHRPDARRRRAIVRRSAPMLVIPVMRTGSSAYSFEFRNDWQRAWAQFRTADSAVDYVRPVGHRHRPAGPQHGPDQPARARLVADAARPIWRGRHRRPRGRAAARLSGRAGDRHLHRPPRPGQSAVGRFALAARNSADIPRMLDEGVRRLDLLYAQALAAGPAPARPDPGIVQPPLPPLPPEETETAPTEEMAARPVAGAARRPLSASRSTRPTPPRSSSAESRRQPGQRRHLGDHHQPRARRHLGDAGHLHRRCRGARRRRSRRRAGRCSGVRAPPCASRGAEATE